MAQHDYIIANQSGAAFRADLNGALAAGVSQNSGATEPAVTYAYMPWADITSGIFKIRNAGNNGWISLFQLDGTASFIPPNAGLITNAGISGSAAIADTKLATITTSGKVSNSATTATSANTANAIVTRDASGNFSAGTITANLGGTPAAPTAAAGTINTQIATTAFVSTGGAPGAIMFFACNPAPTGWLKANGTAISRTVYWALFAAIGTTYGAGDGSTTFNIPDLRGEFPRGWDDGRGVDSGRGFGSVQGQDLQSHTHTMRNAATDNLNSGTFVKTIDYITNTGTLSDTGATGSAETRPRNIALLACIKF
jgi:microcystin-dependent protein